MALEQARRFDEYQEFGLDQVDQKLQNMAQKLGGVDTKESDEDLYLEYSTTDVTLLDGNNETNKENIDNILNAILTTPPQGTHLYLDLKGVWFDDKSLSTELNTNKQFILHDLFDYVKTKVKAYTTKYPDVTLGYTKLDFPIEKSNKRKENISIGIKRASNVTEVEK